MNTEKIGQAAGIIWNQLNSKGSMNAEQLKFNTRFTDALLYSAIGWLAREGKLIEKDNSYELV